MPISATLKFVATYRKLEFLWYVYLIAHFLETRKEVAETKFFFLPKIEMTKELPLC